MQMGIGRACPHDVGAGWLMRSAGEHVRDTGTVLVGLGLWALASANHCNEAASTHMGGFPITLGFPGIQVKPLLPSHRTTVLPSVELAGKLPHSELSIFPDAGHGAIFQCHSAFLDQTLRFLQN